MTLLAPQTSYVKSAVVSRVICLKSWRENFFKKKDNPFAATSGLELTQDQQHADENQYETERAGEPALVNIARDEEHIGRRDRVE